MAKMQTDANSEPLFSVGIISDTHVRSPHGDQSSPYPVNDKANGRARYACQLLAEQNPRLFIHLGDMVHPLPSMQSYDTACEEAMSIFTPLKNKLHFVAGNHDVGDKPMPGSPAAIVNDTALEKYESWFGKSWYSIDLEPVRIVVINSSLINTGSAAETAQRKWLVHLLEESGDHRIILFSHYPLFVHDAGEAEHYDNIANPGREDLLQLIKAHSIELVLSGHVHHFFYNRIAQTQFFTLPSTSFTRQDYADLFKSTPANEFGRDDAAKLAITIVDVFPDNCKLRVIGTDGKAVRQATNSTKNHQPVVKPRQRMIVSMRHPWHESIDLPYNGPMEEFSRKRARNDYPILRLMQLGIYQLRVPLADLFDPISRGRIQDCIELGFQFSIVCLQNDWLSVPTAVAGLTPSISAVEYILPNEQSHWLFPTSLNEVQLPTYLGFAYSGAHNHSSSKPFAHTVSSGFSINELSSTADWHQSSSENDRSIDGYVVQIPWEASIEESFHNLHEWLAKRAGNLIVNLRLASSNPAEENRDDKHILERIIQSVELVANDQRLQLQLDTFMSLDRGYSPRTGLIDRLGNLTSVGEGLIK